MKNNEREVTLKMIKQQVEIWGDYYYEEGEYRDDTIFLETENGDTAIYDPYVLGKMAEHIRKNGVK